MLGKYILSVVWRHARVLDHLHAFLSTAIAGDGTLCPLTLSSKFNARTQAIVHIAVLSVSASLIVLGAVFWKTPLLPDPSWRPTSSDFPVSQILRLLLSSRGAAFLVSERERPCVPELVRPGLSRQIPLSALRSMELWARFSGSRHVPIRRRATLSASMSKHGYGAQPICFSLPA